jgi:type II secretory pathway pseudopilin PulG
MRSTHRPSRRLRRGLSVVEAVISLAIAAMLLTAVGTAFSASVAAINNNDQFFRATQSARVTLNQVLTEVRRAHAVNVAGNKVDLVTYDNRDISYVYDSTAGTLRLVTNDSTTDADYVLTSGLTSFSATSDTALATGGISYVTRVSLSLTVETGGNQVRLSGSAAPRRTQK